MKNYKILTIAFTAILVFGCDQEPINLKPAAEVPPPVTPTGTPGTLNLTKFVTIGNSLVAGYRSGALFTEGQDESLGKIMAKQLAYAGGSEVFNQPDINSVNGFYSSPAPGFALGRLILFDPDGAGPRTASPTPSGTPAREVTCPSTVQTPAVPAPYNNGQFPGLYTGDKSALNNFAVPGILLAQVLTPLTGGPSTGNPAYNGLYARFASNPGTSTILGDAIAAQPTFFLIEVGNNDILGYATTGASGAIPMTSESDFTTYYNGMIATIFGNLPNAKGVVANIPDVTSIPFFFTVLYNAIPMDAPTAEFVNGAFAGYNAAVEGLKNPAFGGAFGDAAALDARKVSFAASKTNRILIADKTATDFGPGWNLMVAGGQMTQSQRDQLEPYRRVRQATPTDLITLSAGAVLGTCVGGNPQLINGVSVPLADQYVLLPSEILEIKARTAAFNNIISGIVANASYTAKLALADVNAAFNTFVANKGAVVNGILLTPSITPPYAGFSEDAVHPNGRGYAFLANIFIDAINAKFGSTIPKADITQYSGNRTPVSPGNSY